MTSKIQTHFLSSTIRWHIGLCSAIVLLNIIHFALKFAHYRTVSLWLIRLSPSPYSEKNDLFRARAYGKLVNQAAQYSPWANCVRRSLVTWWLLRWERIPTEIEIGVRYDQKLIGHAWVTHHDEVVNDTKDVRIKYPISFEDSLSPEQIIQII